MLLLMTWLTHCFRRLTIDSFATSPLFCAVRPQPANTSVSLVLGSIRYLVVDHRTPCFHGFLARQTVISGRTTVTSLDET